MQLRLPRAKDAKPKRKHPPIVSTAPSAPCGICNERLSRYTCPTCNLPYCSLACFRAEQHAGCSEAFQRQTLKEEVQGAPKDESEDEKKRMLRMLRDFEEKQRELEELDEGEESEEDESAEGQARRAEREELEKKLAGMDLDTLDPDALLSLLTPAQQAAFETTLQDPMQVNKLVDDYFEPDEPWWIMAEERKVLKQMTEASKKAAEVQRAEGEQGALDVGEEEEESDREGDEVFRPVMLDEKKLPSLSKGPDGKAVANAKLVYNVVAVLFAYAYTLRTFALTSFATLPEKSTERVTAITVICQLVPFLVERSTVSFEEMDAAVEYVVAREEPNSFPPPLVTVLLQDLASLLRPTPISAISTGSASSALSSHSLATVLSALSDLYSLFTLALTTANPSTASKPGGPVVSRPLISRPTSTSPLTKQQKQQCSLGSAKLLFFASLLTADPAMSVVCKSIAEHAENEAERREKVREAEDAGVKRRREELNRKKHEERLTEEQAAAPAKDMGPKIVEL
ncbi:hypothetical protein JCM11641_002511 [Rhodosporidiobolus odoratus]